jgi:hypothetical protein
MDKNGANKDVCRVPCVTPTEADEAYVPNSGETAALIVDAIERDVGGLSPEERAKLLEEFTKKIEKAMMTSVAGANARYEKAFQKAAAQVYEEFLGKPQSKGKRKRTPQRR